MPERNKKDCLNETYVDKFVVKKQEWRGEGKRACDEERKEVWGMK